MRELADCRKVRKVHFRKFISKNALALVLANCPNLESISLSKYASKRLSDGMLKKLQRQGVSINISNNLGRKPRYASVAQIAERQTCNEQGPRLVASGKISAGCECDSHPELSDNKGGDWR